MQVSQRRQDGHGHRGVRHPRQTRRVQGAQGRMGRQRPAEHIQAQAPCRRETGSLVFAKAVQRIYNIHQGGGTKIRLCFTTNLTDSEMAQRYGNHVTDRIDELVVWLDMKGRGFSERKRIEIK